jgi:autotransporter-associated beta strand protein
MKIRSSNYFSRFFLLQPAIAASMALSGTSLQAAALTWDFDLAIAGAQDGGGTWANATGNWRNTTTSTDNVNWTNADSASFGAGTDGTYAIDITGTPIAPGGITFNNSGYALGAGALSLVNGATNGTITVAPDKTATINSTLTYVNNVSAPITLGAGSILNLGGGFLATNKPQPNYTGAGTVNFTAGNYASTVGDFRVTAVNQSGGTQMFGSGSNAGVSIGRSASTTYTISGGSFNLNSNSNATGGFLNIGRATGTGTATLIVKTGGSVNVGTTALSSGQLNIVGADGNSNSLLDVQGGEVNVGTGNVANKIYFFNQGANASKTSTMTQSGGIVTTNGIQFGNLATTYDASAVAKLALSGGTLYVGATGISKGANATALTDIRIELTGGSLGASATWSSSMDMKLGSGGVTVKTADASDVARDITLSGTLSNLDTLGKLTKSGSGTLNLSAANSYTGQTIISGGTLKLGASASLSSSTIIVGASTTFDVSGVSGGYTLGSAQTLSGTGSVVGATAVAGTLSPGASPGTLNVEGQTWINGGDYNWQILDATGAAGTGFDTIAMTGTLDLSTLTLGGFGINLWSLASISPDTSGSALNFDNTLSQSWNLLTASGGITGFDATDFVINTGAANGTAGFSNDLGGGAFSLNTTGNSLVLNFTAIPEPGFTALFGSLGLLALMRRRRC